MKQTEHEADEYPLNDHSHADWYEVALPCAPESLHRLILSNICETDFHFKQSCEPSVSHF